MWGLDEFDRPRGVRGISRVIKAIWGQREGIIYTGRLVREFFTVCSFDHRGLRISVYALEHRSNVSARPNEIYLFCRDQSEKHCQS